MAKNMRKADTKVVLLGDANVGKTSLILRYNDRRFQETVSTIGASFIMKRWGHYNVSIWDTAGEEIYSGLSNFYCRNAAAAVLAFDLTSRSSFENLRQRYIPLIDSVNTAKLRVVVGTKRDLLKNNKREVTPEEAEELAKELNPQVVEQENEVPYYETSSKTGYNVDEMFEYIFQHFHPNGGSEPRPVVAEENGFFLQSTSVVKEKVPVSCCR